MWFAWLWKLISHLIIIICDLRLSIYSGKWILSSINVLHRQRVLASRISGCLWSTASFHFKTAKLSWKLEWMRKMSAKNKLYLWENLSQWQIFWQRSWSNFSLILFLPFYRSNMRADWASLHLQLATMHHHHHRSPFDWLPLHYDLGSASSRQSGSMTLLLKTSSWPSDRWSSISLRWTYITLCSKSFQFCILPRDTSTSSASRLTHLTLVIRYSLLHII